MPGWVYILHFDRPHHHARHYIGCCSNLHHRMLAHSNGEGANLMKVLVGLGIGWTIGGLYFIQDESKMRRIERRAKNQKNSERFCELCSPEGTRRLVGAESYSIDLLGEEVRYPHASTPTEEV